MLPSYLLAGVIFVLIYSLIIFYYEKKAILIWIGCALMLIFGVLTLKEAVLSINLNVLGLYFGMLFIIEAFIYSKFPDFFSVWMANKAAKISTVLLLLAFTSGLLSIFMENVAVVLIMAPIALSIAKRLNVSAVPILTAIAISSNLQGAATLIGDPPSMLLAGFAKLNFNEFFFFNGKPSMFFAIQLGALTSLLVLEHFFKRFNHPHKKFPLIFPRSYFPAILIVFLIVSLSLSSKFDPEFRFLAGAATLVFGAVAAYWHYFHKKKNFNQSVKHLDWQTGVFLAGVFVMVAGLESSGLIKLIAEWIAHFSGSNVITASFIILVGSLVFSAFIDNVPFIAAMLPVVQIVALHGNFNPFILYFLLLIGASVGGNITPIGASANIVAMGIATSNGYKTRFMDFVRMGLPFTLFATAGAASIIFFFYL